MTLIPMTPTAQQATWSKTTAGDFVPTQWCIEGDSREGYTLSYVGDDCCGFDAGGFMKYRDVRQFIKDVNEKGYTSLPSTVGTFAWRNAPMPA